jgi:hypothetical protein
MTESKLQLAIDKNGYEYEDRVFDDAFRGFAATADPLSSPAICDHCSVDMSWTSLDAHVFFQNAMYCCDFCFRCSIEEAIVKCAHCLAEIWTEVDYMKVENDMIFCSDLCADLWVRNNT